MEFTSRWQTRCLLAIAAIGTLAVSMYAVGFNQSDSFIPTGKKLTSGTQVAESNSLIDDQRMSDFVKELASEKYEGRLPGTHGDQLSIEMVVNEFKKIGLQAAGTNGYLQNFNTTIAEPDGESHGNPENPLFGERMLTSNVMGVLPGTDPVLSKEIIIVSAHRDHLGRTPDGIHYPGANDDLSGLAATLELARAFVKFKAENKPNKRTLMFVAYGAEEQHEMGSMYHVANPLPRYPNKNIVLMITIDMIGQGYDKWGRFSQSELNEYAQTWFEEVYNGRNDDEDDYSHKYQRENKNTYSYDAGPFAKIGINNRVFGIAAGIPTYHKTTDTWETVRFAPAAIFTNTIFEFLRKVDQDPQVHIKPQ
ncbi:M28 family metallopeptidase [Undibacterium sp. SXout11W]|uniref:M28 family metallopeptidase n=1 Tax=Undibacterium sp. SXout11W TaxID=3413050 RepID=UPI003BF03BC0